MFNYFLPGSLIGQPTVFDIIMSLSVVDGGGALWVSQFAVDYYHYHYNLYLATDQHFNALCRSHYHGYVDDGRGSRDN